MDTKLDPKDYPELPCKGYIYAGVPALLLTTSPCPWCSKRHQHGGGLAIDFLKTKHVASGYRVPHCLNSAELGFKQYKLVCTEVIDTKGGKRWTNIVNA